MTPGKLCSQAGHAYLGAFQASSGTPEHAAYAQLAPGTKVCFQGDLADLGRVHAKLQQHGIPHFVVIDSGCLNFFDGQPICTAIGFGPATKAQIHHITRRLKLL